MQRLNLLISKPYLRCVFLVCALVASLLFVVASPANAVNPPTGTTFTIRNGLTSLVFDVPGNDNNFTNGTQIQQYADVNGVDQRWTIQNSATANAFLIVNNATNKALTIAGNSTGNGAAVVQTTINSSSSFQQWTFNDAGLGRLTFNNVGSGKVVDVPGADSNFAQVGLQQWDYQSTAVDQRWMLVPQAPSGSLITPATGNGYYVVINSLNGLVFDVPGNDNNFSNGTQIQQSTNTGSGDQRWNVQSVSGSPGVFRLINTVTSKALTIASNSGANGAAIVQTTSSSTDVYQRWKFVDAGLNRVIIYNVGSGKVVDVPGADNNYGQAGLQQWDYQGGATDQRWRLIGQYPLRFTLTWSGSADLDLQVTEPNANLIFSGNPGPSTTGGTLTGESGCVASGAQSEIINWAEPPPFGNYVIDVDEYSVCGGPSASWTLQVIQNNATVATYSGTSSLANDVTFNYTGG